MTVSVLCYTVTGNIRHPGCLLPHEAHQLPQELQQLPDSGSRSATPAPQQHGLHGWRAPGSQRPIRLEYPLGQGLACRNENLHQIQLSPQIVEQWPSWLEGSTGPGAHPPDILLGRDWPAGNGASHQTLHQTQLSPQIVEQ